jgi:hypothetical protein
MNPVHRRLDPRRASAERWIPAQGTAMPDPATSPAPTALWIEATDSRGQLAAWWLDGWWDGCLAAWGRAPLRLVLLPTPGAVLLRPVLERLAGIREAARKWQLVAQTRGDGLASMASVDRLLCSPYDEIQFLIGTGVFGGRERGYGGSSARRVLSVMKEIVELRGARGLKRPAVVWLWDVAQIAGDPGRLADARTVARQLQVDRFVVPEWVESLAQ